MRDITLPLQFALLLCVAVWWSAEAGLGPNSRTETGTRPTKEEDAKDDDNFYGEPREKRNTSGEGDIGDDDYIETVEADDDFIGPVSALNESLLLLLFRKSPTLGPANYTGIILTKDRAASIRIDDPTNVVGCRFQKIDDNECFRLEPEKEVDGVQYWKMSKPLDTAPQITANSRLLNFNRKLCKANENNVEISRKQKDRNVFKCSPSCNEGEVIICGQQPVGIWRRSVIHLDNNAVDDEGFEERGEIIDLADLLVGLRSANSKPKRPEPVRPDVERHENVPKKSETEEKKVRTSGMANRIVNSTFLLFIAAAWHCKFLS